MLEQRRKGELILGPLTGFLLAVVVSSGILGQRMLGTTAVTAVIANTATTLAAVAAVLLTVRSYVASIDGAAGAAGLRDRRVELIGLQAFGAVAGVFLIHALAVESIAWHPWLRENPRQLVNDLVAVFGVLAFVWACARKPIRTDLMIAGLAVVLGYEMSSGCWHLDAPPPHVVSWSVQRFVGSEVTASGLGVLAFRLMLA